MVVRGGEARAKERAADGGGRPRWCWRRCRAAVPPRILEMRLGWGDGWEKFRPRVKIFAGSPPGGEKNASWGAQRLEML